MKSYWDNQKLKCSFSYVNHDIPMERFSKKKSDIYRNDLALMFADWSFFQFLKSKSNWQLTNSRIRIREKTPLGHANSLKFVHLAILKYSKRKDKKEHSSL